MMKKANEPILRLIERPPGGTESEDRAAVIIRGSLVPAEPDGLQLARIEQHLHGKGHGRPRARLVFRLAFAALFLIAGVASVKAYELARRAGWMGRESITEVPAKEATRSPKVKRTTKAAVSAPSQGSTAGEPVAPVLEPVLVEPEVPVPNPTVVPAASSKETSSKRLHSNAHVAQQAVMLQTLKPVTTEAWKKGSGTEPPAMNVGEASRTSVPIIVASPTPATKSNEIVALDRAMGLLRRDRNALAALAALDTYLVRYPNGVLDREARLARVDALLMLKRSDEALAALETLPLDHRRRSTELQVIRGELRARTDCGRAEADFSVALTHSPDAVLLERILYGRAACRVKRGDRMGATSDLQHYLERFPDGTHAAWARQWLSTTNNEK
jgi:hypothetical protein